MKTKVLALLASAALGMAFIEVPKIEKEVVLTQFEENVVGKVYIIKDTITAAATAKIEKSLEDRYKNNPLYIKGLNKIKNSDCTGCHQVERKLIGPSYAEVAAKYKNTEANVAFLTQKVLKGRAGVLGQIPMNSHPNLSEEDAKDMVRYVLLLRK